MEQIRFCKIEELPKLQEFLHTYWKADHILSKHKGLLDFQHLNKLAHPPVAINYVVAINDVGEFTAVLGYIPTFQYDSNMADFGGDIWLAIWCRAPHATKGVGIKLYDRLVDFYRPRSIAAIGINDEIKKRYESMGFTTGKLNHYYFFKQICKIAQPHTANVPEFYIKKQTTANFNQYGKFVENIPDSIPNKTDTYFKTRYQNHPVYKYLFYAIYNAQNNLLLDIIILRKNYVITPDITECCLRIVDCYNHFKNIKNIAQYLNNILAEENAEYIDCLNFGIPESKFEEMGFKKRIGNEITIPNYFEPFVQENIDIEFAYKILSPIPPSELPNYNPNHPYNGPLLKYVIFKGDSDQDRPNLIHN